MQTNAFPTRNPIRVVQRYQVFLEREQLSNIIEWNKVDEKNQSQYVNVHPSTQYVARGRNFKSTRNPERSAHRKPRGTKFLHNPPTDQTQLTMQIWLAWHRKHSRRRLRDMHIANELFTYFNYYMWAWSRHSRTILVQQILPTPTDIHRDCGQIPGRDFHITMKTQGTSCEPPSRSCVQRPCHQ
jgi:hypothetical protein